MSEWISVKDGIPLSGQKVIIFANDCVQEGVYLLVEGENEILYWEYQVSDIRARMAIKDKWQPLPEPPEEKKV